MFWRWWSPWDFMETEPGQHESQWNALSQRLFGRTFWGDYGGDIVSRFYYSEVLEMAPLAVQSIEAAHGQGLVLSGYVDYEKAEYRDQLRSVITFLAHFDHESPEYAYDDIVWSDGLWEFEYDLAQKEMTEGWWGEYEQRELVDYFSDWEGNTIVPELGSKEWANLLYDYFLDADQDPYWESADSLVVPGWDIERAAEMLLAEYARSITEAGNPDLTLILYGEPTTGRTRLANPLDWADVVSDTYNANRDL